MIDLNKEWIEIKSDKDLPNEFETVLTYNTEDLFPVCGFFIGQNGRRIWLREIEGSEDIPGSGRYGFLYRPPTHYIRLDKILPGRDYEKN